MLYIVLILVLAALGLVVTALVTANSLWAWISIGLSVLAGALLVVDWWRRRSAANEKAASTAHAGDTADAGDDADSADSADTEHATTGDSEVAEGADTQPGETRSKEIGTPAEGPVTSEGAESAANDPARAPRVGVAEQADGDPAEEETDAADLLVVSELDAEVLVVDEYPRYHLSACDWLEAKATIPIAVKEARELGFTPCARCGPDATLASRGRGKRTSRK